MLAEAANGAAAEWDAEHHHKERVGLEPGMAGRDGPRGSSSTALDALGNSPQMDFPTVGSSPPTGWAEPDRANMQQSPSQEQVVSFTCTILQFTTLLHDFMPGPLTFTAWDSLPCQSCWSLSSLEVCIKYSARCQLIGWGFHMQAAPAEQQQQQPASSTTPGQEGQAPWAVSSPPSSCSLPHHLAALIPSPPKVSIGMHQFTICTVLHSAQHIELHMQLGGLACRQLCFNLV